MCKVLPLVLVVLVVRPASAADEDFIRLAARIDRHIAAHWKSAGVKPTAPAGDAEFMRRVYLDLTGRIPTVVEARAFLDDVAPDKRQRLMERLLASPGYVTHFSNYWMALFLPNLRESRGVRFHVSSFERWLHELLACNAGYDELVRELLSTSME